MYKFESTKTLNSTQKEAIRLLWNSEYPINILHETIADTEQYLNKLTDQNHTFVYDDSGNIIAWYFDFIRDQERNFAIVISSEHQKKGLGIELINQAKKNNSVLNGWVIISQGHKKQDGKPYKLPLQFYQKLGFQTLQEEKEIHGLRLIKIRFEELFTDNKIQF